MPSQIHEENLAAELLATSSYREFIQILLRSRSGSKPMSYAALSRKAGFSSRAYVRDVLVGKKQLTLNAFPKFANALGLRGYWREYLGAMVARERGGTKSEGATLERLDARLDRVRARIRKNMLRKAISGNQSVGEKILEIPELPVIFAALGTAEDGATREQIRLRTGLTGMNLNAAIKRLLELELIRHSQEDDRYFAANSHVAVGELSKNDIYQSFYKKALSRCESSLKKRSGDKALFHYSALCVNPSNIPALKAELRETILKFVDQSEDPLGDNVVEIVCALFPASLTS